MGLDTMAHWAMVAEASVIKVNQLQSAAQAQRLAQRIDMAGVCVGDAAPCVSLAQALAIRAAVPHLPLAVALADWRQHTPQQIDALVQDLGASHFEFTPADMAKAPDFADDLARLQAIRCPKVANGFFLLADDLSCIDDEAPYQALQQVGVALFQFEIDSALDPNAKLSQARLQRVDAFLAGLPVLVGDRLQQLAGYPLAAASGFFFDLAVPKAAHNDDKAQHSWAESQLMRLLPTR